MLAPLRGQVEQLREDLGQQDIFVVLHYEEGLALLLPHLGALNGAAQTLLALVETDLHQGRLETVQANLLLLLRLEALLANDRLVICQTVRYALAQIALKAVWEALQADGWTDDQLAQLQAACAKPRYFNDLAASLRVERAGQTAASLAALVPELLPALPRDYYSGQPLRYRPLPGHGFVLYSGGQNGKDDGGDAGADNWTGRPWFAGRDLVWPQAATAAEVAAAEKKRK